MKGTIQKILELAVYAPSGDNSQPWRFEVQENKIKIFNLPEKDNPILNVRQRGSYIAHGALMENISIIAPHFGYRAEIEIFPDGNLKDITAAVTLQESVRRDDPLFSYISTRVTNRKYYQKRFLSDNEKSQLLEAANAVEGGKLKFVEDEENKRLLGETLSMAEKVSLETRPLHKLFFDDIVWSKKEEKEKQSGLYLKTLELPFPVQLLFRLIRYWPIMKIFNLIGFPKLAAKGNAVLYSSSSAIGIITAEGSDKSFINAGRIMQRVWLTSTKLGLNFQPVTGIIFLKQRVDEGDGQELFSPENLKIINEAYEKIKSVFEINKGIAAMLFRIGDGGEPSARSSKKPPEIFLW